MNKTSDWRQVKTLKHKTIQPVCKLDFSLTLRNGAVLFLSADGIPFFTSADGKHLNVGPQHVHNFYGAFVDMIRTIREAVDVVAALTAPASWVWDSPFQRAYERTFKEMMKGAEHGFLFGHSMLHENYHLRDDLCVDSCTKEIV